MTVSFIPQKLVLDSPVEPNPALLRTVLASVFNRDITADTLLSEAEVAVVLGAKLLKDLGFEMDDIQIIFRRYKSYIEEWGKQLRIAIASRGSNKALILRPKPIMLMISDNRRAALLYENEKRTSFFDFKKSEELIALAGVAPILQLALNLSQLFESAVDTLRSEWYHQTAKEAVESAQKEDLVVD
jgi:hypothetical protein